MVLLAEGRGGRFTDNGRRHPDLPPQRRGTRPARRVPPRGARTTRNWATRCPAACRSPPQYFTVEAVAALAAAARRPVDFRTRRLAADRQGAHRRPLPAAVPAHPERTLGSFSDLESILATERVTGDAFRCRCAGGSEAGGPVRSPRHRPAACPAGTSARQRDLTDAVVDYIGADLRRRADPYFSADAAVFDALLTVYGVLAVCPHPGMIGPADRIRFVEGEFHGFFSFLASGPPPRRLAELLALHRAGLVEFAGPELRGRGRPTDGSRVGPRPPRGRFTARALVDARLPRPDVRAATDPVIRGLLAAGELAAEDLATPTGRPLAGRPVAGRCELPRGPRRPVRPSTPVPAGSIGLRLGGSAGFSRPGFNGAGFRQNDAVARQILRTAAAANPPAVPITSPTPQPIEGDTTMPVEFLGIAGTNPASEVTPRPGGSLDLDYTRRLARAHEDNGWDRILFAYHSGSPDPAQVAAYVAGHTERIKLVLAHRPNVSVAHLRRQDLRHPGPHLRRPVRGAFHHRRVHRRPGRRGRLPGQGHPIRTDPRVHPDREAGLDLDRAVRLRRRALSAPRISARTSSRCSSRGRGSPSAVRRRRPTRSAPPSPTSTRSGASRWPAPASRSRPSTRPRPRPGERAPATADRLPPDHRPDRGTGLGEGRDDPRADQGV